jgi:hypothetical protein
MFDRTQDIGAPIVEPITTPNAGKVISFPWLAPVLAVVEDVAEGQLPEGAELEGRLDAIATKHKVSVALVRKAFRAEVRKYKIHTTTNPVDSDATKPTLAFATDPEPVVKPLSAKELLEYIVKTIHARIFCKPEVAHAQALWILASWGIFPPSDPDKGVDLFPFIHISSPAKRCGKSTDLETVQYLVRRPLAAADVSEAALYRVIEKYHPTLLIDEFDRLIKKLRELTGLLNSAHTRNGSVIRTVEMQIGGLRTFEPVAFSTFSPIVLAGIGAAPSTIEDRSIRVRLQRQPPQGTRRGRIGRTRLQAIRDKLAPHLMAHAESLATAMTAGVPDSEIPAVLNDRDADNWRPLIAVAKLAGGPWPDRAARAAMELCRRAADGDDRGGEWALRQIIEAVGEFRRRTVTEYIAWRNAGRKNINPLPGRPAIKRPPTCCFIPSDELAAWLVTKDDSGFGDCRDLNTAKLRLARLLRPFKIVPELRRNAGQPTRGYDVPTIRAAWRRYRP